MLTGKRRFRLLQGLLQIMNKEYFITKVENTLNNCNFYDGWTLLVHIWVDNGYFIIDVQKKKKNEKVK